MQRTTCTLLCRLNIQGTPCDGVVARVCTDAGPTLDEPTWMVAPLHLDVTVRSSAAKSILHKSSMARGLCSRLARLIGLVAKTLSSFIKYRTVSRLLVSRRQSHARPSASRGLIAAFHVHITYSMGQGLNSHPICRVDRQTGCMAPYLQSSRKRAGDAFLPAC